MDGKSSTIEGDIPGPKILLIGPTGTGKTHALGTLVDWAQAHNKEVFALFTEASVDVLLGYWRDSGKEVPSCLHWHSAYTKPIDLTALIKGADNVGKMSYEVLTKMSDPDRAKNNAFFKILSACSDFPDDRSGKKFGSLDSFGPDKIFILDSLSELANAAFKMVIGSKPTASMPDYMVAQNNLMNFIRLLTQGVRCTVAVTGHVSREKDEITGGTKLTVMSIGSALSTQIPPLFSEVIMTNREGDKFTWDTATFGADLKTRSLGYRSKIEPDFAQIMDTWIKRGGK